jgi:hypothetical protein
LTPGASCNISVTFRPTVTGTRTAKLSITDNAAGSPQKVALSGSGVLLLPFNHCVVSGGVLTGSCFRTEPYPSQGVCVQQASAKCPVGQPAKDSRFLRAYPFCRGGPLYVDVDLSTGC